MANHPNRSKKTKNPAANPTPVEIRAEREKFELTQSQCAELVYTTTRNWQQWESEVEGDSRRMHRATWELFYIKLRKPDIVARLKEDDERSRLIAKFSLPLTQ